MMTAATSASIRHQLCFAIYSASHAFTRVYRRLLKPLGITYPQYLVMLVLWEKDGRRVKEIGAELFLDSGTLTPLLKRLEGLGYVRRVRDPDDERQVTINLTASGVALQTKSATISRDLECITGMDSADMNELLDRIAKLRTSLQNAGEECVVPA